MLVKIEQFAPDADHTIPGVAVSMTSMVPTFKGYKAAPTAIDAGVDALASECFGAAVVRKLDNTTRLFAGVATKLYEVNGTSWTDVSRVAAYGASANVRWDFAQFGNVTIACNKADTLQSSSSGAFADIAGAPKAKLVETVNQFVIIADTDDAGFGDSPDRWWCCAIGDYTDWTPDVTTLCVSGRLTSAPGRINALKRLGDGIVAYKDRSMFLGSYVGAPEAWSFQEIPGEIGCVSQNGVVDIGAAHVFLGYDNFYTFDGSRPVPIGNPIKDWFFSNLYTDYAYKVQAVHDRPKSNVYFFYPSLNSSGALDSCVVFNYRTNKWGVDDRNIEAGIDYISAGVTWGGTLATTETWASISTATTWDSQFLAAGQPAPAYFSTAHKITLLTGAGDTWALTTNDFGDDSKMTTLRRVRPRFMAAPTSCTMTNYYVNVMGDTRTQDATTTYTDGKFDVLRSARWHRLQFNGSGGGEIAGIDVQGVGAGSE